jgi:hypothetical protein
MEWLLAVGLAIFAGLVLFFSGRLRQRYGSLRPSETVTQSYERFILDPDLAYYSSGPEACPVALIGIDKELILDETVWTRRHFRMETFREPIRDMQRHALSTMQTLHGFEIADQQGRRIGTWFSVLNVRTTIKALEGNRIRIDPPPSVSASDGP